MISINRQFQKDIDALQNLAEKHSSIENAKFVVLCEKIGMDPDGPEGDLLFDYIYNKTDWTIDFT